MPKRKYASGYAGENTRARVAPYSRSVRSASSYRRRRSSALYRTGGRYVNRASRKSAMAIAGMEAKNIDDNVVLATAFPTGTTTGQLLLLNGIAQGTTATSRIGRKIMMKSLLIRLAIAKSATQTGEGAVRCMVVYDSQANATAPAVTDILQVDNISGVMNLNNADRFKVVMDKVFNFGAVDHTSVVYTKYKKIALETKFNNGSAGTVGDIQTGSMYLLTHNIGITTAPPIGSFYVRIRFYD